MSLTPATMRIIILVKITNNDEMYQSDTVRGGGAVVSAADSVYYNNHEVSGSSLTVSTDYSLG